MRFSTLTAAKCDCLNLLILLMLLVIASYGQQAKASNTDVSPFLVKESYTEEQLSKMLTNGMSVFDLTNKFGLPESTWTERGQIRVLSYLFQNRIKETNRLYLIGFDVRTKEDRVVRWSPVTQMRGDSIPDRAIYPVGKELFSLFVGNDNLSNLVDAVNSKGSVEAGALATSPDMTFEAETFVEKPENKAPGRQTVEIWINEQDALKLKALTTNNIGKPLLIVCRNKIIAAPTISEPLGATHLRLTTRATNIFQ